MRHGNVRHYPWESGVSKIPILPMRHGNNLYTFPISPIVEFRSYLWGMETNLGNRGTVCQTNDSDPTYEAWKPDRNSINHIRERIPILPMRHGNSLFPAFPQQPLTYSDPTYEAWKQHISDNNAFGWRVFRSYLWGMETSMLLFMELIA